MCEKKYSKVVIILGSSSPNGQTAKLCQKISQQYCIDIINLGDYEISIYDYANNNREDDFLPLVTKIIKKYDKIVFATPVYWYAMSATMKILFDRFTDLLTIEKGLGRQLRGKDGAVITCSIGNHLGDNFWIPFKATFDYLGMNYLFGKHFIEDSFSKEEIDSLRDYL